MKSTKNFSEFSRGRLRSLSNESIVVTQHLPVVHDQVKLASLPPINNNCTYTSKNNCALNDYENESTVINHLNDSSTDANAAFNNTVTSLAPVLWCTTKFTSSASSNALVISSDQNVHADVTNSSRVRNTNNPSNELIVESGSSGLGPSWPVEFKLKSLIPVLLTRPSNMNVRLKMYT